MPSIQLQLPKAILDEIDLPYEGARDLPTITLAVQGISVAANVATLLTIRPHIATLVTAIRNWRFRHPDERVVLTAKGPGIDLQFDLPPNVSRATLLRHLQPLLDDEE